MPTVKVPTVYTCIQSVPTLLLPTVSCAYSLCLQFHAYSLSAYSLCLQFYAYSYIYTSYVLTVVRLAHNSYIYI